MTTETPCPCCRTVLDALRVLEDGERCPNPSCRATADDMFAEAIDDDDSVITDDEQLDPDVDVDDLDEPTTVYPVDGPPKTVTR